MHYYLHQTGKIILNVHEQFRIVKVGNTSLIIICITVQITRPIYVQNNLTFSFVPLEKKMHYYLHQTGKIVLNQSQFFSQQECFDGK